MKIKNIKLLSFFNFFIGFNLFWPIAIIYFSKVSGSYALGTSIFGIIMLASTIFEIPTGILSDFVGRKYTIVLGSWARVFAFVFYAIGVSYWFLVIGAIFEGLSRAFYSGNNDAFLYDTLADHKLEKEYHEFQGKVSSSEQFSMGVSALIGGVVANYSYFYLMWLSVIPQILILIISYLFNNPSIHKNENTNIFNHINEAFKLFIHNKKLRLLSLASMIDYSLGELKWEFTSAFTATIWPIWAIGISKMLPSFGASISFYFSGRIIKKFKEINILIFQSIYGKIISLVAFGFPSILSPLLISTSSLLYGVGSVSEKTLMQREFTPHQRATMSSLNSFGGSLGFALMSVILGSLADSFGPAKALIFLTLLGFPVIYLYWIIYKND